MLNSKLIVAVILSVAKNLLDSSIYAILWHTYDLPIVAFRRCLRIQEISRYARNDNINQITHKITTSWFYILFDYIFIILHKN